jgi:glycosyltransferase involved in cell wall biosynthesis
MPKIASEVRGDCLGRRLGRLGMVGVAIPARNERDEIPGALHAVVRALEHPSLGRARRVIVVANDGSEDDTGDRARRCLRGIGEVLDGNFGSAGEARGAALERLVAIAGDLSPEEVWFATTDADSRVPPSWLAGQVRWWRDGADAVAGMVAPIWGGDAASAGLRARYEAMMAERGIGPSHPHVYGANLGFTAEIYLAAGGVPPVPNGEDHALVDALRAHGARVVSVADDPVRTSARLVGRASDGFAALLARLSSEDRGSR